MKVLNGCTLIGFNGLISETSEPLVNTLLLLGIGTWDLSFRYNTVEYVKEISQRPFVVLLSERHCMYINDRLYRSCYL